MAKFFDILGKILVGAVTVLFFCNVLKFAVTGDLVCGIWAILLALSLRVSGKFEIVMK